MPVLVGVAPAGLVSYPGCRPDGERVLLEENHPHFVLAQSSEWNGETSLLIGLPAAYAAQGRTVVVLAGGGRVSKSEILESAPRLAGAYMRATASPLFGRSGRWPAVGLRK